LTLAGGSLLEAERTCGGCGKSAWFNRGPLNVIGYFCIFVDDDVNGRWRGDDDEVTAGWLVVVSLCKPILT